jgi:cbb3-type cytochrome oxidase subunit 3
VESLLPIFKQFWVVWMTALFVGIVIWVYRPGHRREMDDNARIPFRDAEGNDGREG